jgi:putative redox protein
LNCFWSGHIAIASQEFYGPNFDVSAQQSDKSPDVVVHGGARSFKQEIVVGKHSLVGDEPVSAGGGDAGPDPYDYLLAALGVCTSMTVGLYARRKQIPLENITVSLRHSRIYAKDCEECETEEGMLDRIEAEVELTGALSEEQRDKLMEIAAKCPVHRTLTSEINIRLSPAQKSSSA